MKNNNNNKYITLFYDNDYLLWLSISFLFIVAISGLSSLPVSEDPIIGDRYPTIEITAPGYNANRLEILITNVIENELFKINEIKEIDSNTYDGVVYINPLFHDTVQIHEVDSVYDKIRSVLTRIKAELPDDINEPVLLEEETGFSNTLVYAMSFKNEFDGDINILGRLADELSENIKRIPGTNEIKLYGEPNEIVEVAVNSKKLHAIGLTYTQLADKIFQADSKIPAGQVHTEDQRLFLEVLTSHADLSSLGGIVVVTNKNAQNILLSDIATLTKTHEQPRTEKALHQEQQAVLLAVRATPNFNIQSWINEVQDTVKRFSNIIDENVIIDEIYNQSKYTEKKVSQLLASLALGILACTVVVLIFMGWRSACIVSLSIPLTLSGTIYLFSILGIEINKMSIFGLLLSIGLLIDNAIIITSEIRRLVLEEGVSSRNAMLLTFNLYKVPLFVSSMTTVLGFLPVLLLQGSIGDFLLPMAASVIIAISLSYLISISIIAAIAAKFIDSYIECNTPLTWYRVGYFNAGSAKYYAMLIRYLLQRPKTTMFSIMMISFIGFYSTTHSQLSLFPWADRDYFIVNIVNSNSASASNTQRTVNKIQNILKRYPEVKEQSWVIGAHFPSVYYTHVSTVTDTPSVASGMVYIQNKKSIHALKKNIQDKVNKEIHDAIVIIKQFSQGNPEDAPIQILVVGQNFEKMNSISSEIIPILLENPDIDVVYNQKLSKPKFMFLFDNVVLETAGLTKTEVANQMNVQLNGINVGVILDDTKLIPVTLRMENAKNISTHDILSLNIYSNKLNKLLPLSSLGSYHVETTQDIITHKNGRRVSRILGYLSDHSKVSSTTHNIKMKIEQQISNLPDGYDILYTGGSKNRSDAVTQLMLYLPIIITMAIMLLILSFNCITTVFIISSAACLSVGMGFLALSFSGLPISFTALIGCAGLIGIAINGSIVVISGIVSDTVDSVADIMCITISIMHASRHIFSTAATTLVGFTPLMLSGGELWPPLAVTISGGVAFSVIISLLFTPCAFIVFNRFIRKA